MLSAVPMLVAWLSGWMNTQLAGILLLFDAFGFENSSTRDSAYRVACNGYNVLVTDLFRGNPWIRTNWGIGMMSWGCNMSLSRHFLIKVTLIGMKTHALSRLRMTHRATTSRNILTLRVWEALAAQFTSNYAWPPFESRVLYFFIYLSIYFFIFNFKLIHQISCFQIVSNFLFIYLFFNFHL